MNPVFFAYAIVTDSAAALYIDNKKISEDVKAHLGNSVDIRPYDSIFEDIEALGAQQTLAQKRDASDQKFLISNKASWALSQSLGGPDNVDEVQSPVCDSKAIKNETELEGMRNCHIRDGAALIKFFAWLEEQLVNGSQNLDEVQAADKLELLRA